MLGLKITSRRYLDTCLANDSFPLKSFLIFAFLYFLEAKFKGVIQFLHPIVRKQSKGKNTNKAWKENKVFAEGCRNLKYLQPFRIRVKEKLCNRYRYEIFLRIQGLIQSPSLCFRWINSLLAQKHSTKPTRQLRANLDTCCARLNEINLCFLIRIMMLFCIQNQSGFRDH